MLFYASAKVSGEREVVKVKADNHAHAVEKIQQWARSLQAPIQLTGSVLALAAERS